MNLEFYASNLKRCSDNNEQLYTINQATGPKNAHANAYTQPIAFGKSVGCGDGTHGGNIAIIAITLRFSDIDLFKRLS